jgi:hypothetical protein
MHEKFIWSFAKSRCENKIAKFVLWLNVCAPLKFLCWNETSIEILWKGQVLKKWLHHESSTLKNRISSDFEWNIQVCIAFLLFVRMQQQGSILETETRSSPDTEPVVSWF